MRLRPCLRRLLLACLCIALPAAVCAGETATATVAVAAQVSSRTSLTVSARTLQFAAEGGGDAVASIDFVAAARTWAGAEVLLTVEALHTATGTWAAPVARPTLWLQGAVVPEGAWVRLDQPAVAGRWIGSGVRSGLLVFALKGAGPGVHDVPLRFVLSAP